MSIKKLLFIFIPIVIILVVIAYFFLVASRPSSNMPSYLSHDVNTASLLSKSDVDINANTEDAFNLDMKNISSDLSNALGKNINLSTVNTVQSISNPSGNNSFTFIQSSKNGKMIQLKGEDKIVPINRVMDASWATDSLLLILSGKPEMSPPSSQNQYPSFKITGQKGAYIYNIKTQEKIQIYGKTNHDKLFSWKSHAGYLFLSTGFSVEKLDMDGNYIGTIYKTEDKNASIAFTSQNDKNKISITVNTGVNSQIKNLEIK